MSSNIQFTSELASSVPNASAVGKARLFRDTSDGILKLKDHLGAVVPLAGLQDYKESVRVATAAPLPAYTRTGNVITATAFGALPAIDGVTLVTNDSLLYWHGLGPTADDNGIYVVTQVGSVSLPFILTRRGDFADSSQVSPGAVTPIGPEGLTNKNSLFILATAAPIVLNTTPLSFEAISGGGGFSLTEIDVPKTIPSGQSMLYSDDVVVDDDGVFPTYNPTNSGDLLVEGDITPVREEDNFSVNLIPQRSVRVVQENDQMLFTDSMTVDGDLVVDGDILDATPYDGYDILAALTAIAPLTPSILGVSSPAGFKTPLEARIIMDVPSNLEMAAAIVAANAGLAWSPTVQTGNFLATPGLLHQYDSNTSFTATLPPAPTDGDVVGFVQTTGGGNGPLLIDGGTHPVIQATNLGNLIVPLAGGVASAIFKFNAGAIGGVGAWFPIYDSTDLILSIANTIRVSDNAGVPLAIQLTDESVLGRTGGGSLDSIPLASIGGLPFTATVYSAASVAESGKLNRIDGTATFTFTFPTNPPNGTVVGLMAIGTGGTFTLAAGGSNTTAFGPSFPFAWRTTTAGQPFIWRFDNQTSPGVWRPELDGFTWGLGTNANQLPISNTGGDPQGIVISNDSFVGRSGGGNIGTLSPATALTLLYPNQTVVNASLNTTGNTPTTITSYVAATDNAVITFDLLIQAQSNDNTDVAVFKMVGVCHRAGGAATVTSKDLTFVNGPYRDAGAAAWAVTFNISGGGPTIDVQVTGDAAEDIDWRVTGSISEHS